MNGASKDLSRSQRVARGFNRIAFTGAAIFAVGAAIGTYFVVGNYRGGITVETASGFKTVVDDGTPALGYRLAKEYGEPKMDYASQVLGNPVPDSYPYATQITLARVARTNAIEHSSLFAVGSATAAILWAAMFLVISWILRGFMKD